MVQLDDSVTLLSVVYSLLRLGHLYPVFRWQGQCEGSRRACIFTMGAGASSRKAAVAMLKDKQATVAKLTSEEMDTRTRTASSRVTPECRAETPLLAARVCVCRVKDYRAEVAHFRAARMFLS